jgi:uncharacterized lipoprotein YmbA
MTRPCPNPAALGLILLALAGCATSGPTRLYTLTPLPPAAATVGSTAALPPVRVLGVRLPPAFDRLEVVRLGQAGRVELSDFDRWAAAPGALAAETFGRDLELRLPGLIVAPPFGAAPTATRTVVVVVTGLEPTSDGVLASAYVEIHAPPGDPAAGAWPASVRIAQAPGSAERQVDLWSRLVAALADQTAQRLGHVAN